MSGMKQEREAVVGPCNWFEGLVPFRLEQSEQKFLLADRVLPSLKRLL